MFEVVEEAFGGRLKVILSRLYFEDDRGFLNVPYLEHAMDELGLPHFVREIHSRSEKNVLRGLHIQTNPPMSKLMRVSQGSAYFVAVDFDPLSPTFLSWHSTIVSEENRLQVWAAHDVARGFCALEDGTEIQYKCSNYFDLKGDKAVRFDDPDIGIQWPITNPILSERDANAPSLRKYLEEQCNHVK